MGSIVIISNYQGLQITALILRAPALPDVVLYSSLVLVLIYFLKVLIDHVLETFAIMRDYFVFVVSF